MSGQWHCHGQDCTANRQKRCAPRGACLGMGSKILSGHVAQQVFVACVSLCVLHAQADTVPFCLLSPCVLCCSGEHTTTTTRREAAARGPCPALPHTVDHDSTTLPQGELRHDKPKFDGPLDAKRRRTGPRAAEPHVAFAPFNAEYSTNGIVRAVIAKPLGEPGGAFTTPPRSHQGAAKLPPGGRHWAAMVPPWDPQGAAMSPSGGHQGAAMSPSGGHQVAAIGPSTGHGVAVARPSGIRQGTATGPPDFDIEFWADLDLDAAPIDLDTGLDTDDQRPEITRICDKLGKVIDHFRRCTDEGNVVNKALVIAEAVTEVERAAGDIQPDRTAEFVPAILALGTARSIRKNRVKRKTRKFEACRKGTDLIARLREKLGGL